MALKVICAENNPESIMSAANELPPGLAKIYEKLYDKIECSNRSWKKDLARRVISWVHGARVQLKGHELIKAVRSPSFDYMNIELADVLEATHHLVVFNRKL
jgi:hypothetical protein